MHSLLSRWYKDFPQYPVNNADYWRVKLIFHVLLLASCVFSVLTLINLFVFQDWPLVVLDGTGLVLCLLLYALFRSSGNVQLASLLFSAFTTGIMIVFLISAEGRAYSIIWATVIPPLTFFLVGRNRGLVLSGIVFATCIYYVYQQVNSDAMIEVHSGALLNVVEASAAHLLLFRFYERTRDQAYAQLLAQQSVLKKVSETDALTGLYNREKFERETSKRNLGRNAQCCLVVVDIDKFKRFNDNHGHAFGDKILKAVASRLQSNLRDQDLLARWGGEEFVALLVDCHPIEAQAIVERWLDNFHQHPVYGQDVTFSAGIAPCDGRDCDFVFAQADAALYQAKAQGRDQVVIAG